MSEKNVQLGLRKKYEKPELTRYSPLREITAAAFCHNGSNPNCGTEMLVGKVDCGG